MPRVYHVGFAVMDAGGIVVAGEALIDLVPHAPGELRAHAGGGPYNTARTLGRLEQPVHYLGCLSDDGFGRLLREQLQADGVGLDTAVDTELPTTLALAEVDPDGVATYRFYKDATSAAALEPEQAVAALPPDVDILHIGGGCIALGLGLEPTGRALQALVEAAAGRALVTVDPNCRPAFIPDREAYRRGLGGLLRHADVVKASGDDLAYLEPSLAPADAARSLLADGPAVAVVTLGGDGALIVTAADEEVVPAPQVHVVDTIGAGDAFGGGFLAWWRLRGHGRAELADPAALRGATAFACTVAARTCERPGASPPTLAEVQREL
jgi:fructokinase